MFISRKKYKELCERVRKLEDRTYDLEINEKANLFGYGAVNFREFCRIFTRIIDDRISKKTAADKKPIGDEQVNIIEATKAAQENGACIKRAGWDDTAAICPTEIGYELLCCAPEQKRLPMWNPKTEDVLADDWIVGNFDLNDSSKD